MAWVVINGALLVALALAAVGVSVLDRAEASVETSVRRYASAVTSGDLGGALAELAPARREMWREWVSGQLGNVYQVRGIAVRSPSVIARLSRGGGPLEVTVVLDVNRDYPDLFYQPTARVPVEASDGRWYLAEPLLAKR
ncbi:MAG: hypothetical protein M3336_16260 [Chloroflexota bacterium]|nr:hypothetical protein [Chloroflexota bacterium]